MAWDSKSTIERDHDTGMRALGGIKDLGVLGEVEIRMADGRRRKGVPRRMNGYGTHREAREVETRGRME